MAAVDKALGIFVQAARVAWRVTPVGKVWRLLAQERRGVLEEHRVEPITGRPYRVMTRIDHDRGRSSPALFALHAYASSSDLLLDGLRLRKRAVFERGFVLVVPEGTRDRAGKPFWNATAGCSGEGPRTADDVAYLRAVLADVRRALAVQRVYAVGVSNGAFMAHRWAAEPGGDLRGIACISGTGPGLEDPAYSPSAPVRVLQIHGALDDVIHVQGGRGPNGTYPSVVDTVAAWRRVAGPLETATSRQERTLFGGVLRREEWRGKEARVASWIFESGTHHLHAVRWMVPEVLEFLDSG